MIADTVCRAIARCRVKEAIRRQATIRPGETMFDGVCPVQYGLAGARIPTVATIRRRVEALERWIDSELPTLKP